MTDLRATRIVIGIGLLLLGSSLFWAAPQDDPGQWAFYGGDLSNSHFLVLDQINKCNVSQIQIAWVWNTGDATMPHYDATPNVYQTKPLMNAEDLYVSTPLHRIAALQASTRKELCVYDPRAYDGGPVVPGHA